MNTRYESLKKTDREKRKNEILEVLEIYENGLTARETAEKLGYTERNATAPRLTELVKEGKVIKAGTRYDEKTERHVAIFFKVGDHFEQ